MDGVITKLAEASARTDLKRGHGLDGLAKLAVEKRAQGWGQEMGNPMGVNPYGQGQAYNPMMNPMLMRAMMRGYGPPMMGGGMPAYGMGMGGMGMSPYGMPMGGYGGMGGMAVGGRYGMPLGGMMMSGAGMNLPVHQGQSYGVGASMQQATSPAATNVGIQRAHEAQERAEKARQSQWEQEQAQVWGTGGVPLTEADLAAKRKELNELAAKTSITDSSIEAQKNNQKYVDPVTNEPYTFNTRPMGMPGEWWKTNDWKTFERARQDYERQAANYQRWQHLLYQRARQMQGQQQAMYGREQKTRDTDEQGFGRRYEAETKGVEQGAESANRAMQAFTPPQGFNVYQPPQPPQQPPQGPPQGPPGQAPGLQIGGRPPGPQVPKMASVIDGLAKAAAWKHVLVPAGIAAGGAAAGGLTAGAADALMHTDIMHELGESGKRLPRSVPIGAGLGAGAAVGGLAGHALGHAAGGPKTRAILAALGALGGGTLGGAGGYWASNELGRGRAPSTEIDALAQKAAEATR